MDSSCGFAATGHITGPHLPCLNLFPLPPYPHDTGPVCKCYNYDYLALSSIIHLRSDKLTQLQELLRQHSKETETGEIL